MNIEKAISCSAITMLALCVQAQEPLTPPIQPHTVPVVTPPAISVPPPKDTSVVPGPISAEEASRIALKHQPQVAIARAAIKGAHGNVLQAEAALLPTGAVQGGYGQVYALPGLHNNGGSGLISQGFNASVTVSQLLFDFGRTVDSVRVEREQEKANGFNLTTVESDTVLTVKQNFYTFVQNLRSVDVASANLKDRQDNLALAQARLNAGVGSPGDVVTAQTNLAASTVTLIEARNTASTSEVALALSMGIDPRTPIEPSNSEETAFPIDNVDKLVDEALKQRPEIKQQQALIRSAGFSVSVARKSLLPSINLELGASGASNVSSGREGTVGIVLNWDPFDVVGARGRTQTAEANVETARQNLISASQNVVSDISTAYLNIKSAEQRITTSQSEVTNATEGLRIAEGQFKAGVATFVTVTDAETNLAQARVDLVTSQASLQLARAAMEHALGRAL